MDFYPFKLNFVALKILAVILSVYFLCLGVVPCEDDVVVDKNDEVVQVDAAGGYGEHAADDCSPFCQCHCCHVHVVTVASTSFEALDLSISTHIIQNGQHTGFDLPDSHFQPPRV